MMTNAGYVLSDSVKTVFVTPPERSAFCGYYDKSPLDEGGTRLLALQTDFDGRSVTASDTAEVGWFDIITGRWNSVGLTQAFNWQQGAMLQWLGGSGTRIVYNSQTENRLVSNIVDIGTATRREIPFPIYAVHPDGKTSIAVNFERHYFCRAYHYEGVRVAKWACDLHPDDGLFRVDLETGDVRRIISTKAIAERGSPVQETVAHWLEHVWINPTGSRFLFLHRCGGGERFKGRLFSAALDGSEIFEFPAAEVYSHAAWMSDTQFVVWALAPNPLMATYRVIRSQSASSLAARLVLSAYRMVRRRMPSVIRRTAAHAQGSYQLMTDRDGVDQSLGVGQLTSDGHPSFTKDGRFLLTDTYADARGYRHLQLYDVERKKLHSLGRFFSPFNNSDYRCDLHPRFSNDNQMIVVDTAHSGRRQVVVLKLDWKHVCERSAN